MSLHNKPEYNTPEIVAALKQHGLDVGTPSQLSDTFRLGWLASLEAALAAQPSPVEAQAVPDQPVARVLGTTGQYHTGSYCGEFESATLLPNGTKLFTRPTPAAADLHQQIMNLPCKMDPDGPDSGTYEYAYAQGHRDARHAAAQLVAASPAAAAQQSITKEQALESLSEVGLWLSRDPHALRLRQFIEQASPAAAAGVPTGTKVERSFKNVAQGVVTPTVLVTLPAIQIEDVKSPMWDERDRIADALASPVAPVGAPTRQHSVHLAGGLIEQDFRDGSAPSTSAPSAELAAKQKLTMRINYERISRRFWHQQCTAQRHSPPMAIDRDDKNGKRTLLRCTACERAGWYPYGCVGEVCCEEQK